MFDTLISEKKQLLRKNNENNAANYAYFKIITYDYLYSK